MNQLNAIALKQLKAWEDVAREWLLIPKILEPDNRTSPLAKYLHLVCHECDKSVYHVGHQTVSPSILLAAVVAHLRSCHLEIEDVIYSGT